MNLSNIVSYIRKNHRALGQLTSAQIATIVTDCLSEHLCIVSVNDRDEINGIVLAKLIPEYKIMHVEAIIAKSKPVLRQFLDIKRNQYNDWKLEGFRKANELIQFPENTVDRLYA